MCCSSKAPVLLALQSLHLERSLARSPLPIPSFFTLKQKNLPQGRQQQQLTGSSRSCNKEEQSQKNGSCGGRRRSKKRRRAYREGNTERQRQRETHTRSVAALSLLAVSVLPCGYCSSIHHDDDEVCLFFCCYCLSFFYCCILSL